jgi:hypothetical protein
MKGMAMSVGDWASSMAGHQVRGHHITDSMSWTAVNGCLHRAHAGDSSIDRSQASSSPLAGGERLPTLGESGRRSSLGWSSITGSLEPTRNKARRGRKSVGQSGNLEETDDEGWAWDPGPIGATSERRDFACKHQPPSTPAERVGSGPRLRKRVCLQGPRSIEGLWPWSWSWRASTADMLFNKPLSTTVQVHGRRVRNQ